MTRSLNASFAVAIVVACGALGAQQPGAQQPDRAGTDALSRRAAERLRTLREEADRLASEERTVLGDLRKLEIDREIRAEEFRQAQAHVAQVTGEFASLDAQIAELERQARDDIPDLRARLVSLYKLGSGRYVRLLLSTTDLRRIGQASRMVAVLADQDRARVAAHQRRLEELTASRRGLEERQARLAGLRTQAERARVAADAAVAARNALVRQIDQRRDLNAQLLGELLTAQQKLQSAVAGMPSASPPALPIGPFRGDLDWPVAGTVRQRFGGIDNPGHGITNGIDIAAAEGLPVRAVHDGTVAFADVFTGFGRLVIVDHGGQTFSLYGNLKDIAVARGSRVLGGDTLGSVGVAATGATGLYFELRVDGHPVDPLQWLKKR
jgi:murein hydrolase activator